MISRRKLLSLLLAAPAVPFVKVTAVPALDAGTPAVLSEGVLAHVHWDELVIPGGPATQGCRYAIIRYMAHMLEGRTPRERERYLAWFEYLGLNDEIIQDFKLNREYVRECEAAYGTDEEGTP